TYFNNTQNYLNQKQSIQFSKNPIKLHYHPNLKLQIIRPKNKYKSDIQSPIHQTPKYPLNHTHFITHHQQNNFKPFSHFHQPLHPKTLISYPPFLKQIHKKLNLHH
uniref:protein rep n=1 Tax=Staphylococcus epidermidis TaxID=1282 RepID=UPI001642E3F8